GHPAHGGRDLRRLRPLAAARYPLRTGRGTPLPSPRRPRRGHRRHRDPRLPLPAMGVQDLTPQLRTRLLRVERLVGLFVRLAALALIAGFAYYLYYTAVRKGWFVPKASYYTLLRSAEGIGVGDPIALAGFSVGEVTLIDTEPPGAEFPVFLAFRIRRPYYGY